MAFLLGAAGPLPGSVQLRPNLRNNRIAIVLVAALILTSAMTFQASAGCQQSGLIVTCSGTEINGFSSAASVTLTVAPGAVVNGGQPAGFGSEGPVTIELYGNATIVNNGQVNGHVTSGNGIFVAGSSSITNNQTIIADGYAIYGRSSTNDIVNNGSILSGGSGIFAQGGGTITNNGSISGNNRGVGIRSDGTSTVINNGTIASVGVGTEVFFNSTTINNGSITAVGTGMYSAVHSRIINNGTIVNTGSFDNVGIYVDSTNVVDNFGTVKVGDSSSGIRTGVNTINNYGWIIAGNNASGIRSDSILYQQPLGNTITNSGTILVGNSSNGILASWRDTVTNAGLIKVGVDGYSIAGGSSVVVQNYGILDGRVNLLNGSNVLTNNGLITITNGNTAIGSQHFIDGNFIQTANGTLALRVNPSTNDVITVTGTATLAGAVQAIFASGSYISKQYTILHSAGLSGTFSTLSTTNLPANFNTNLSYTTTDALLNLTAILGQQSPGGGFSGNQSNVANALNGFFNNGGALPLSFSTLFGLTGSALSNALTQISGEAGGHGGSQTSTQMMGSFLTLALNPFGGSPGGNPGSIGIGRGFAAEQGLSPEAAQAYAAVTPKDGRVPSFTFDRRWGIWGQAYGGINKTGGDTSTGTHDTTSRSYGLATGADYRASPDLMLGFALAGGGTSYGLSDGLGGGKSDVFQMGVYGSKQYGKAYVSAALSHAWHGMKTDRTVTVSGTDNLTARFNAHSFGGRMESGYRFDVPLFSITPYAALQVQQFRTPSYSETAKSGSTAFALSYDAKSTTSTRTELGAWLDKMVALDRGHVLAIRTRAAWAHDHSSDESVSAAFQTLPGSGFTMNGAATVPNSGLLSVGAEIRLASGLSFGAKFDGEFANRSQTYAGTGTVRSVW